MSKKNKTALALEILKLSIEITNNSDVDVFVEYLGHTNGLYIRVFLNGWKVDRLQPDFNKSLYLEWDCVNDLQQIIEYLKLVKEKM